VHGSTREGAERLGAVDAARRETSRSSSALRGTKYRCTDSLLPVVGSVINPSKDDLLIQVSRGP
jgi:hypothetical protein